MIILAIETSCDETSVAILENKQVLSNVVISQVLEQKEFKGVVPGLAAKLHLYNIEEVFRRALAQAKITPEAIDYVAYTEKPGLVICLQIGKAIAETFALYLKKPLVPVNHLEGHLYATLIGRSEEWEFPALALIISGGHTQLSLLKDHFDWEVIGNTLDDTVGELLDKVAICLGYGYPGGPVIEKLAQSGKDTYKLTVPKNDKSLDFSFSGLKSEIKRLVEKEKKELREADLACSLQWTVLRALKKKLSNSLRKFKVKTLILGGGVTANNFLREQLTLFAKDWEEKIKIFFPLKIYSTDNAAMIGFRALYKLLG